MGFSDMLKVVKSGACSSRMQMGFVWALVLMRVSKLVLSVVMPGCDLLDRIFFRMVVHVCWSVLTSWRVCPFMVMCRGGLGGPLRMAWKTVSLRIA